MDHGTGLVWIFSFSFCVRKYINQNQTLRNIDAVRSYCRTNYIQYIGYILQLKGETNT